MVTRINCRNSFGVFDSQYPIALQGRMDPSEFGRIIQHCTSIYNPKYTQARKIGQLYAATSVIITFVMVGVIIGVYVGLQLYSRWWLVVVIVIGCSLSSVLLGMLVRRYRFTIQQNGCQELEHFLSRENARWTTSGVHFNLHRDYIYRKRWRYLMPRIEIVIQDQQNPSAAPPAPAPAASDFPPDYNPEAYQPSYGNVDAATAAAPRQWGGGDYNQQYGWNTASAPPPPPAAQETQQTDFNPTKDPYSNPYSNY